MACVATLISNPAAPSLDAEAVERARRTLPSAQTPVWLDPGIGFGKTPEHNLELIRRLDEIVAIGRPVVIGSSRKTFLGRITGRTERERVAATVAANVLAYERGASVFRVHDVPEAVDSLKVAAATVGRTQWTTTPSA